MSAASPWARRMNILSAILIGGTVVGFLVMTIAPWKTDGITWPPDPGGARVSTKHLDVRADVADVAFVESVAALAERQWSELERAFRPTDARAILNVYSTSESFQTQLRPLRPDIESVAGLELDVPGLGTAPLVCVTWSEHSGAQVLAHELTHRFVRQFIPDAPPWLNEGIATELTHSSDVMSDECVKLFQLLAENAAKTAKEPEKIAASKKNVEELAKIGDALAARRRARADAMKVPVDCPALDIARVDSRLATSLAELDKWDATRNQYKLAAAVVRFAIVTKQPKDLSELRGFAIDKDAFAKWVLDVRADRATQWHDRFPVVTGN